MSPKKIKLILSFIIGMVLSLITLLLLEYSSFFNLIVSIVLLIGIGGLAYGIVLKLSNSKGISILSGIIIGFIGIWIVGNLLDRWIIAVELADTGFGVFLLLLPVGLIWTFIVYSIASAADKNSTNKEKKE